METYQWNDVVSFRHQGREKIGVITVLPPNQGAGQKVYTIYVDDDDAAYEVREEDIVGLEYRT